MPSSGLQLVPCQITFFPAFSVRLTGKTGKTEDVRRASLAQESYRRYLTYNPPQERFDDDFFNKYAVRTDLALEATEVIVERGGPPEIRGGGGE